MKLQTTVDLSDGIRAVWEQDREFQLACIEGIVKNIRKVKDPDLALLTAEELVADGMFYVPDDDYMPRFFGPEIKQYQYGIYIQDLCKLAFRLAMPIRLMDDTVPGFIGYTPPSSKPEEEEPTDEKSQLANVISAESSPSVAQADDDIGTDYSFVKYLYPPKSVLQKERYMYITRAEFLKALKDQYICIVDGLFDKRRLQMAGINATSLCGSALTPWHVRYLNFIPHKIVIHDNDPAGLHLLKICQWKLTGCVSIRQGENWDIDDFLKTKENILILKDCIEQMKSEGFLLSKVIKHKINRGDVIETKAF